MSEVVTQRLFFALWPSEELQSQWAEMAHAQFASIKGRFVPAQNLHITLAFLGDVNAEQCRCVEDVANGVKGNPFSMNMERIGHWRRPQVVWLGPKETPKALERLASSLNQGLIECGFPVEKRAFKAHMTLMRKVSRHPGRIQFEPAEWQLDRFVLVESQLTRAGAKYKIIKEWPLAVSGTRPVNN